MAPGHVLVVGSLNADLVTRVARLPAPGETVLGSSFEVLGGGKGANQAVAAARAGAAVKMIGRVGDDSFGALLRRELVDAGVDAREVEIDPARPTGTAQIVVDAQGRNQIAVAPGANAGLSPSAVEAAHAWEGAAILVLQLEVPLAADESAARAAARRGLPVVLNAAPARALTDDLSTQWTWLIVNECEAGQLAGGAVASVDEAAAAAARLRRAGQGVIVTLGAAGAVMVGAGGACHLGAPAVRAVDTVAAGDAFVGVFAAALAEAKTAAEALARAVMAGSLACTRRGAIPSLPTAAEISALLAEYPRLPRVLP